MKYSKKWTTVTIDFLKLVGYWACSLGEDHERNLQMAQAQNNIIGRRDRSWV